MTEAFCAPETGTAGYSVCRSTHGGCSNLNWPLSSSEAEEQKQRCLKPLLYSLPEAAPSEAQQKVTADCKRARNEAGQNKASSPNSVFYPDTKNPKIAPCCKSELLAVSPKRKREMSQLLLMFIPALVLTNVISLPQHCFGITHWKPGAVSLSWHTELIKSEF